MQNVAVNVLPDGIQLANPTNIMPMPANNFPIRQASGQSNGLANIPQQIFNQQIQNKQNMLNKPLKNDNYKMEFPTVGEIQNLPPNAMLPQIGHPINNRVNIKSGYRPRNSINGGMHPMNNRNLNGRSSDMRYQGYKKQNNQNSNSTDFPTVDKDGNLIKEDLKNMQQRDRFANLMSHREKRFVVEIQMKQLRSNDPNQHDYYYQKYMERVKELSRDGQTMSALQEAKIEHPPDKRKLEAQKEAEEARLAKQNKLENDENSQAQNPDSDQPQEQRSLSIEEELERYKAPPKPTAASNIEAAIAALGVDLAKNRAERQENQLKALRKKDKKDKKKKKKADKRSSKKDAISKQNSKNSMMATSHTGSSSMDENNNLVSRRNSKMSENGHETDSESDSDDDDDLTESEDTTNENSTNENADSNTQNTATAEEDPNNGNDKDKKREKKSRKKAHKHESALGRMVKTTHHNPRKMIEVVETGDIELSLQKRMLPMAFVEDALLCVVNLIDTDLDQLKESETYLAEHPESEEEEENTVVQEAETVEEKEPENMEVMEPEEVKDEETLREEAKKAKYWRVLRHNLEFRHRFWDLTGVKVQVFNLCLYEKYRLRKLRFNHLRIVDNFKDFIVKFWSSKWP